jgi:hypothetical protein
VYKRQVFRDFLTEKLRPMIQACTLAIEADKKSRREAEQKAEATARARRERQPRDAEASR